MTTFALPERVDGMIFDVDSTLYTCAPYAEAQIRVQFERLATIKGLPFDEAVARVEAYRAAWSGENGGRKLSLGNTLVAFGIPIEESVRWREELVRPEDYLSPDPRLRSALERLRSGAPLVVVTNNPASVGRRTLAALGVEDLFLGVVGLDTCGVSKPHEAPFLAAAELMAAGPGFCVAIGDRYDIDVALPLALGMGGVVVDGVDDVYRLPELLGPSLSGTKKA